MTAGESPPCRPDGAPGGRASLPYVVLTQAVESGESLAREFAAAGLRVLRWPLVRLSPMPLAQMQPVLERLGDYDWVLLPSPSAVRLVARQMDELGIGWPERARAGLVGPASVEAFRACFGDRPEVDAPDGPPHDAARLVATLQRLGGVGRVLVLNRPDGRLHWLESLRAVSDSVDVVPAYEAQPLEDAPPPSLLEAIESARGEGRGVAWVAGAASQIDLLVRCLPAHLTGWLLDQPLHVPHPALREHALGLGFRRVEAYDDRAALMLRLQYPGPTDIASPASVADNKEGPLLSSDEQKDPANPGVTRGSEGATAPAASAVPPASPSASPSPSQSPAPATSPTPPSATSPTPSATSPTPPAASSAASATSPAGTTTAPAASKASAADAPRPPFSSPAPRMPDPPRASPPVEPPGPAAARPGSAGRYWGPLLLLLLIALAIAGWWYAQQRFLEAERESARRVQEAESRAAKLDDQLRGLRESQNQLQARSKALEAKIAESSTQQEQLSTLYEEIARSRGDSALVEAEQSVQTASQHLELHGNVRGAILALEAAERRLAESDHAAAVGARRLVLADIERLKALPEIDLTRLAARLDEVIARVDRLPLLADANQPPSAPRDSGPPTVPASPAPSSDPAAASPAGDSATGQGPVGDGTASQATQPAGASDAGAGGPAADADAGADAFLQRLWARIVHGASASLQAVREEFRSVVTIRRVDQPDNLLLSPEQKTLARDNLKLLLLNARLDLINRHGSLFRKDIERVVESMQGLFDMDSHEVKTAVATLQSLQSQPLTVELPSLSESLSAVKAARAASEKRS